MSKKLLVITGGTKGLGRGVALHFGARGYRVLAIYSKDENAAESLRAELTAKKIESAVIRCDLAETFDFSLVFKAQQAWLDESEITLIHGASAVFSPQPFMQIEWDEFQTLFQTNVHGFYQLVQGFLPRMVQQKKGAIISILSETLKGEPPKGFSSYTTAKAALQALTRSLAAEYSRLGIKIYSFSPGYMDTPLTQSWDPMIRNLIAPTGQAKSVREIAEEIYKMGEDHAL